MLTNHPNDHLFDLIWRDPQAWLRQAKQLRLAAEVIFPAWEAARRLPPTAAGAQEQKLACSEAFMLLTAFSFENLLKGILYGGDPQSQPANAHGGHGIVDMARAVGTLHPDELDLLKRLQEYLLWAGRYQTPRKAAQFHAAHDGVRITTQDPHLIDGLFTRWQEILTTEWRQRGDP